VCDELGGSDLTFSKKSLSLSIAVGKVRNGLNTQKSKDVCLDHKQDELNFHK